MNDHRPDERPDELEPLIARLRAERANLDRQQLDQIKQRVLMRAAGGERKSLFLRSRLATAFSLVALVGGSSGALALAGSSSSNPSASSAASGQYKPGKGCGDKNHTHTGSNGNQKPCPKPNSNGNSTAAVNGSSPSTAGGSTHFSSILPAGTPGWTTSNGANGTVGKAEHGDTITLTFNMPIDPASILAGWSDATSPQRVWVRLSDSGPATSSHDTVTICAQNDESCSNPLSLGTLDLGGNYINSSSGNGYALFGGTGSSASTMQGNAGDPTTITITLGELAKNTGSLVTQDAASKGTWGGWSFKNPAGASASPSGSATQPASQKQF